MTRVFLILCSVVTGAGAELSSSEVPARRYQELWENSPFTSPREVAAPPRNDFDKFALGGVSMVDKGYFVVLIDKQNAMKRIVLKPGEPSELQVLRVNWSNQDWRKTAVVISDGEFSSSIGFDSSSFKLSKNPEHGGALRSRAVRRSK
ncbi:hypothetical protein ACFQY0_03915 [Haloferula chungangensis]|uniref:Uncharacterized protein n=1 Tax=Haloferula chungangensis TaxID=1048331 RepID=A0ABW2L1Y4_9BACT